MFPNYCPLCGEKAIWQQDFWADEIFGEGTEGSVSYYHCPDCDILLQVFYDEDCCTVIRILN